MLIRKNNFALKMGMEGISMKLWLNFLEETNAKNKNKKNGF